MARLSRIASLASMHPSSVTLANDVVRRQGFAGLARGLGRRHDARLAIRTEAHGLSTEEVVWSWGAGSSLFAFDPSLFEHPYGAVLVERWLDILPLLLGAVRDNIGHPGTTSLALGDCGFGRGLAFCDHRPDALLIPDPVFVREDGYLARKAAFAASNVSWNDRRRCALWRGQTSGWHDAQGRPVRTWADLPRVRLCRLARDPASDAMVDAGITGIVQIDDTVARDDLAAAGLAAPRVDWRSFPEWRYQIDVDGNASSWEGLFTKLCTGSPVLKAASGFGFRQWYYDRLVPWSNFVPVEADLSDLLDKVRWLRRHDHRAELIGRAAQALANDASLGRETDRARATISRAFTMGA